MSKESFALTRRAAPLARLDRETSRALVRQGNEIGRKGELHRLAIDEYNLTYLTAKRMTSCALATSEWLHIMTPRGELGDIAHERLQEEYLLGMIDLVHSARRALLEEVELDSA